MPSIDQFVQKDVKKKKFQKVAHRPWTVITTDTPETADDILPVTEQENVVAPALKVVSGEIVSAPPSPSSDISPDISEILSLELPEILPRAIINEPTFIPLPHSIDQNNSEFHPLESANNLETIRKQSGNNQETIPEQFQNNSETVPKQFRNSSQTIQEQFENNSETKAGKSPPKFRNNQETVPEQSGNNSETISKQFTQNDGGLFYARLVGFQKHLFLYIAKRCMQHESLISGPIFKHDFKKFVSEDLDTIKTTLQRLVSKGFIKREHSKSGAGGFSVFSISEDIKNMLLTEIDLETIGKQLVNDSRTISEQSDLLSSSSYIYKKTTTTSADLFTNGLPTVYQSNDLTTSGEGEGEPLDVLEKIDPTPLAFIGFSRQHLQQLKRSELSSEMINDSIQAFAFDLQHNNVGEKIKTHPLNFFMGILRMNQPYAAPANFQDPKVLAMKQYLERKKLIREERKRMEEEIFQFAYEEWAEGLNAEQVAEIIPETRHREYPMREGFLKNHFREKLWDKSKMMG